MVRRVTLVALVAIIACSGMAFATEIDNVGLKPLYPADGRDTAAITEYTDYATWAAAAAVPLLENRYAELGGGVIVTNQYAGMGAVYTDGNDITYPYGDSTDGMLLNGSGRIYVTFDEPVYAVGMNYPGAVTISGFLGAAPVFTSSDFGGSGAFFFAGIVSTDAFDNIEIKDWVDDAVYIDDLFYPEMGVVPTEEGSWSHVKALFR
jgi:hypothetical protein